MNNYTQQDARTTTKAIAVNDFLKNDILNVQKWRRYIEQQIGFVLPDMQLQWLVNAVDHTAVAQGLTLAQLWNDLPLNNELRQQLIDAVLIPESRFFRHIPSIEFVTERALQYQQQAKIDNRNTDDLFRIWSVGCAKGQEVWTLAMSLASQQLAHYFILGTDVSQQALKKARLGHYDERQKYLIPKDCQQFIQPLTPESTVYKQSDIVSLPVIRWKPKIVRQQWQVSETLRQHVRFTWHNIFTQDMPTSQLQQIIICQNMLLYFRKFDQRDILARLSAQCAPGGYIILAPGEALFWRPSNMRRIAHPHINAWQKISA